LTTVVPDAATTMLRFWKLTTLDFKKAGIKLSVDVLPFGHYVKALRSVKYHLVTVVTAQPASWCDLYSGFHSTMRYSGTNFGRVSDKKLDKMLLKWLAEPHVKRRRDMERNILTRVRKITAVFPLYSPPLTAIVSRRVLNLKRGGQWWRFDRVRVRPD
jgi:ABC-type transport system substrate-binding protein